MNNDLDKSIPANTSSSANVVLMLARRLRRRPNIKTTLDQRLVFAGYNARKRSADVTVPQVVHTTCSYILTSTSPANIKRSPIVRLR